MPDTVECLLGNCLAKHEECLNPEQIEWYTAPPRKISLISGNTPAHIQFVSNGTSFISMKDALDNVSKEFGKELTDGYGDLLEEVQYCGRTFTLIKEFKKGEYRVLGKDENIYLHRVE